MPTAPGSAALAAAALALAACARQAPPPPPEPPPRPAVQRPARPSARPDPARADRAARDREAQAACAYQASLVEDRMQDQSRSALGLDGVLAGQSAREACLRTYRQTGRPPEIAP